MKKILLILLFSLIFCIYEDEIGKEEIHMKTIGEINKVIFDKEKAYIISNENKILSSINGENGEISKNKTKRKDGEEILRIESLKIYIK
jgi:hypothetical protein